MASRKRYAVVGVGSRSRMYTWALLEDYKEQAELVAMCDTNQTRMDYHNREFKEKLNIGAIPTYKSEDFLKMLRDQRIDTVIVTSIDRTHDRYIIAAMEAGVDVICEKPMTTDEKKCQAVIDTIKRTGKSLKVTFNYRYAPRATKVKELLKQKVIGDVKSVHFEWLLDTQHGADYFRRWHRDKRNSGGLMVHKATHHFDIMNWWLDSAPKTVFGFGDLVFYGRDNAEARGITNFYDRAHGRKNAEGDPFAVPLESNERLKGMYLDAEHEDGYQRDRSVFSDGISIEDDMAVLVRYRNGATMSYHLTAYSPWEGHRVMFNGTKGRLEYATYEKGYVSGSDTDSNQPELRGAKEFSPEPTTLLVRPLWAKPMSVELPSNEGGHGGGDKRLLDDLILGTSSDPLGRAANHIDGAMSILTGIAANKSFASGMPVEIDQLVKF
jgi:predicted dehydrogenase